MKIISPNSIYQNNIFDGNNGESQNMFIQNLRDQNNFSNKQNSNHSQRKQLDNNFINSKMSIEYKKQLDHDKIYHQEFQLSDYAGKNDSDVIKKSIDCKI